MRGIIKITLAAEWVGNMEGKLCPFCDKTHFSPRSKFCCMNCRKRHEYKLKNPVYIHVCDNKNCMKEFETTNNIKKFCSVECRNDVHFGQKKKKKRKLEAIECGNELCKEKFMPKRPNNKYCSPECQIKQNSKQCLERNRARKNIVHAVCKYQFCEEKFPVSRKRRLYCSSMHRLQQEAIDDALRKEGDKKKKFFRSIHCFKNGRQCAKYEKNLTVNGLKCKPENIGTKCYVEPKETEPNRPALQSGRFVQPRNTQRS